MAWPKDIFKRQIPRMPLSPVPCPPHLTVPLAGLPFRVFFLWPLASGTICRQIIAQEFKTIKRRTALSTAVALRKTSIHSCVLKIHSQGQRFAYNFWTDPRTKPTKNPAHTREKASPERQTSRQRSRAKPKC